MRKGRSRGVRSRLVAALFVAFAAGLANAQDTAAPPPSGATLTSEEIAAFLEKAAVVRKRDAGKGVTDTVRATLSDGRITHDAQIQTVDVQRGFFDAGRKSEVNFKDTYRFNIGGYRLAVLLGLENVPMSVPRDHESKRAAFTWWIDDVQFDEMGRLKQKPILGPNPDRTLKQIQVMRIFDELIQNVDRNQGNIVWTKDWTLWMIDHTRAFRLGKDLRKPDQLTRCPRALLDAMRGLTLERLQMAMSGVMQRDELEAVLARRDRIVKHFDARIATRGEGAVLF